MATERAPQSETRAARAAHPQERSPAHRAIPPSGDVSTQLLALQRSAGNQAVGQLIQRASLAKFGFYSGGPIRLINPDSQNTGPGEVNAFGISSLDSTDGWIEQS